MPLSAGKYRLSSSAIEVAGKADLVGGNEFSGDQTGKFFDRGGAAYNSAPFASLDALLTEIGANEATILLAPGDTKTLTDDLTIPANVTLLGQMGVIATNGHTLTIEGPLDAGNYQVFDTSGGGSVVLNDEIDTLNVRWWGTDTAALASVSDSLAAGMTVLFPKGVYSVSRPSDRAAIFELSDLTDITFKSEPGARIVASHDFSTNTSFWFAYLEGCETTFDGIDLNISVSNAPSIFPIRAAAIYSVKSASNPHRGIVVKNCRLRVNHPTGGDIPVDADPNHDAKIIVMYVAAGDDDDPAANVVVRDNYIYDSPGRTVWLWNVTDVLIDGNTFDRCSDDYPIVRAQVFSGRNIRVVDNLMRKMAGQGPAIEFDGKWRRGVRDVVINGNNIICYGNQIGINLWDIEDVTVGDNTIVTNPDSTVSSSNRIYAGVRIHNSQVADPPANQVPTGNIVLGGNIIRGRSVGIVVEAEGPVQVNGGIIADCLGHGIEVRGGLLMANGVLVSGNGGDGIHFNQLPTDINGNDWTVEGVINGCVVENNTGNGIGRTGSTGDVSINGGFIRGNDWGANVTANWFFGGGVVMRNNASGNLLGTPGLVGDANFGLRNRKRQSTSSATTDQHDFDSLDLEVLMFNGAADIDLTGIDGGTRARVLYIMCKAAANSVTLKHADANSTDGNRFSLPGGADYVLGPNEGVVAIYDDLDGNGAWKLFAT